MTTLPQQNRLLALAYPVALMAGVLWLGFWTLDEIRLARARAVAAELWVP